MKIITMYLPQFHRVKENDEWWGEGYTDWESAKSASQLFEGHYQPHIPQNNNYYDLTDKDTLIWQADLMKKYGVDGQCIYHYWFKDGKKILEKPAEILLKERGIDMPFCFCWANQSWANSWSAIKGVNVWCKNRETKDNDNSSQGLLLEQQYGNVDDWEKHFNYLLPFFTDSRYIKENGKPIFVIYQTSFIDVLKDMKDHWNKLAKKNGLSGIYFIGANCGEVRAVDEVLYSAPQLMFDKMDKINSSYSEIRLMDYDRAWKYIIKHAIENDDGICGAFVSYDDTPRRGNKGHVIDNISPEVFRLNLAKIIAINKYHNKPYTFINAWNEWGEGMHLEPDERWGECFLEGIKYAREKCDTIDIEQIKNECIDNEIIKDYQRKLDRYKSYWLTFDKWFTMHERGKTLGDILKIRGITDVAIYGLGMVGKHLVNELDKANINILCGIDRNDDLKAVFNFDVYNIKEIIEVDTTIDMIVTISYGYEDIKSELIKNGWKGDIHLIDDLLS